ncbi:MAG: hypothetical protein PCFJNLEI_00444 [Verrucomicrobiae bacterium]|nr:hypothetical protein [Verrucomicrobiae bacterium]
MQAFNAALLPETRIRFYPHAYDDATVGKYIARSEAGEDLNFVLWDGLRIVGYFFLWYYRQRVPLLGIGLLDELHGLGLGRQLMKILIAAARGNGNEGIELTTFLDNHRAFALYEKMGFRYLGNVENLTGDGRVVIERAMFLALKPGAQPMTGPHQPPV